MITHVEKLNSIRRKCTTSLLQESERILLENDFSSRIIFVTVISPLISNSNNFKLILNKTQSINIQIIQNFM